MSKRIRIPRASLSVAIINDADFIGLTQDTQGWAAFGVFAALIALCRDCETDVVPLGAVYRRLGVQPKQFQAAIGLIAEACTRNGTEPWATIGKGSVHVRSFRTWNPMERWGGSRENSGRPKYEK